MTMKYDAHKRTKEFPKPLMYISGGYSVPPKKEIEWLKKTKCTHRCYSYAYVRPGAFFYDERVEKGLKIDRKQGIGIMMDSSAFSFHWFARAGGKVKKYRFKKVSELRNYVIGDYTQFILEEGKHFDFYVNFDYVKKAQVVYNVQKKLEGSGIVPMPMFHGDAGYRWLRKYIDEGYKYIGIGSSAEYRRQWSLYQRYYDEVFEIGAKYGKDIKFHGFAATGFPMMFGWPWYSVDSASWAKVTGMGQIMVIHPITGHMQYLHVSDKVSVHNKSSYNRMEKSVRKSITSFVEDQGFDFEKVRTDPYERGLYNAMMYSTVHRFRPQAEIFSKWRAIL